MPLALSNIDTTYLVGTLCGVAALAAFVGLVVVPAATAYSRPLERAAAIFMSLYVLVACAFVGVLVGAWIWLWVWPRVFP